MAVHARHAGFAEAMPLRRVAGRDGAQAGGWSGGFSDRAPCRGRFSAATGRGTGACAAACARGVRARGECRMTSTNRTGRCRRRICGTGPWLRRCRMSRATVAASPLNAESTPGITTKLARRANIAACSRLQGRGPQLLARGQHAGCQCRRASGGHAHRTLRPLPRLRRGGREGVPNRQRAAL